MKIRVFYDWMGKGGNPVDLEAEVNGWLEKMGSGITVVNCTSSVGGELYDKLHALAILYMEKRPEEVSR